MEMTSCFTWSTSTAIIHPCAMCQAQNETTVFQILEVMTLYYANVEIFNVRINNLTSQLWLLTVTYVKIKVQQMQGSAGAPKIMCSFIILIPPITPLSGGNTCILKDRNGQKRSK